MKDYLGRLGHGTLGFVYGARSCCLFTVILIVVLILGSCAAFGAGVSRLFAAPEPAQGLDVVLVLDQSQSLFDMGGVGSDAGLLRLEGARLFASYLGVDGSLPDYRLAAVYFGTQAELVLPLTSIRSPAGRRIALDLLQAPTARGWTDINAALELAEHELTTSERARPDHRTAIVIFTDGRPELESFGAAGTEDAYLASLREHVQHLGGSGTAIFTLLLHSPATEADPGIQAVYRPFWMNLAETVPGLQFYDVRQAEDLTTIYHDVVVTLHGWLSQGSILQQQLTAATSVPIPIPSDWQQFSVLVHKSAPEIEVTLVDPAGRASARPDRDVATGGNGPGAPSEVWTVRDPVPGTWQLRLAGRGAVSAWLDYVPRPPTPTPAPTPPTATATATAAAIPTAVPLAGVNVSGNLPPSGKPAAPSAGRVWRWMGVAAVLATLAFGFCGLLVMGVGLSAHRRGRRPVQVDGVLRQVAGMGEAVPGRWDLSRLGKATVTIGRAGDCDIALPDQPNLPPRAAQIQASNLAGGDVELVLTALEPSLAVAANDRPVTTGHPLAHGDVIQIGPARLRYENVLRLRSRPALRSRPRPAGL